jgi:hypothetical protein
VVHAIGVFSQIATATDVELLVASAGAERSVTFCDRFGFRSLGSQPGWSYLVGKDVQASLAALL